MDETKVSEQEFGKITFANEVLATIAGIALVMLKALRVCAAALRTE